jgi:hypothetical protein
MSFIRFHILEIGTVIRVLARLELDVVNTTGQGEIHGFNRAETDDALVLVPDLDPYLSRCHL